MTDPASTTPSPGGTVRANVAVCGTFHYRHYVRFLHERGCLNHFYYSHRRGTDAAALGLPIARATNAWLKEYLVHGHGRLLGSRGAGAMFPWYNRIWESAVLRRWEPASLLHLMLHGTGERLLRHARREGMPTLGEPVNSCPAFYLPLLRDEYHRLGLPVDEQLVPKTSRITDEIPFCDFLLSGSDLIRRSYVAHGFPAERAFVIPYAADLSRFRPPTEEEKRRRDGKFRVICVAQIVPRKGHVYLLEAWKKCAFPDAELLFIGSLHPCMRPILDRHAGSFRHIERVSNADLYRYYGQSSVFALMSVEDGFGYVCTEAQACGLPVIVTENTGAADVVRDGETGYILPIRDVDALCQRLQTLHASPELRETMSRQSAASMHGDRTWDTYAGELCNLYRTLASHG